MQSFDSSNPSQWWKTIKRISGYKASNCTVYNNLCFNNEPVNASNLSETINNFLVSISDGIPCLDPSILDCMRGSLGPVVPDDFIIPEYAVYRSLCNLKLNKATGPDGLSNRLLKSLADQFCGPLCSIINCSIRTGFVPSQWKIACVTPIPKIIPPINIENHLRPISITSSLSKIAESFICRFFDDTFRNHCDPNQFGGVKGKSTTLALIKFSHYLFKCLDNRDKFVRILFVDFVKAFDLINHNILFSKMENIQLPPHIKLWFLSFLYNRSQFVNIESSFSSVKTVNAGTPQGTLSGPVNFNLLINDLQFFLEYLKYVDDTNYVSESDDPLDDSFQNAADYLSSWCTENETKLNVDKTKEMLLYFGKKYPSQSIPNVCINGMAVERVRSFKLLGVIFNDTLTWTEHVIYLISKASKRIFSIVQLVKSGVCPSDVIKIYCSIIRSVLEYSCQVWHPGLTSQQSKDIEMIQKRCLRIIFPNMSYNDALTASGLERLSERRERMTRELFQEIKKENHVLHSLLQRRKVDRILKNNYDFNIPRLKTFRSRRDFINYCLLKRL